MLANPLCVMSAISLPFIFSVPGKDKTLPDFDTKCLTGMSIAAAREPVEGYGSHANKATVGQG